MTGWHSRRLVAAEAAGCWVPETLTGPPGEAEGWCGETGRDAAAAEAGSIVGGSYEVVVCLVPQAGERQAVSDSSTHDAVADQAGRGRECGGGTCMVRRSAPVAVR